MSPRPRKEEQAELFARPNLIPATSVIDPQIRAEVTRLLARLLRDHEEKQRARSRTEGEADE